MASCCSLTITGQLASVGPLPVVLIRSPYGRAGLAGSVFAAPLARRGFQVFIQSARGTFGSGGQFRPFLHERPDGLATVAWLREQPWCDGRVAMTGGSYLGHTQWAIAPYVEPPLASVSLNITAARITAAFYDHGAPGLRNALNWSGQIGRQERGVLPPVLPNPVQHGGHEASATEDTAPGRRRGRRWRAGSVLARLRGPCWSRR